MSVGIAYTQCGRSSYLRRNIYANHGPGCLSMSFWIPPPIYTDADGHNIVQQCDIVGLRFAIHAAATKTIQLRARFSAAFVLIALKNTGVNNENGI